jgi:hypothetical protein
MIGIRLCISGYRFEIAITFTMRAIPIIRMSQRRILLDSLVLSSMIRFGVSR